MRWLIGKSNCRTTERLTRVSGFTKKKPVSTIQFSLSQKLLQVEALYRETANEYHQLYERLGAESSSSSSASSAREEALLNAVSKAKAESKELEDLFVQEKVRVC